MSAPPAPPAPPPVRFDAARLFTGLAFALVGLMVAVVATAALGYGRDIHPLRAAALCACLLVGYLLAARLIASMRPLGAPVRGAALFLGLATGLAGVVAGVTAWLFVPCRPGGMFLVQAVMIHDVLKAWTEMPLSRGTDSPAALKREFDALAQDYPSLAAGLRPDLDRWTKGASQTIADRFRRTAPGDTAGAAAVRRKGRELVEAFPAAALSAEHAEEEWTTRAVEFRGAELEKIGRGDWEGFNRTNPDRRALADEFPQAKQHLLGAERQWAMKTVLDATAIPRDPDADPKQVRRACREVEKQILALKSLDAPAEQFLNHRKILLWLAQYAANTEVGKHFAAGRYDLAYGVASAHWLEWLPTAEMLGGDERERLASLRDGCRYLALLREKAGYPPDPPDTAPAPRARETAPPPREKP